MKNRKAKMTMNQKLPYMNALTAAIAHTKIYVPKQRETSGCMYPKTLSVSDKFPMKTSCAKL